MVCCDTPVADADESFRDKRVALENEYNSRVQGSLIRDLAHATVAL